MAKKCSGEKKCPKPCDDCAFRKNALKGWLGPYSVEDFEDINRGDVNLICHTSLGKKHEGTCVGYAMVRVNSCKSARGEGQLKRMEEAVRGFKNNCFKWFSDFVNYHKK